MHHFCIYSSDCDCEKRERKDDVENLVGEDLHNREGVQEGKDRELVDGWGALTQECWGVDRSIPHGVLPSKRKKGPEECQFLPPDKPCGFVLIGPSKAGGSFLWIFRTDLNLVIYVNFNQHANQRPKKNITKKKDTETEESSTTRLVIWFLKSKMQCTEVLPHLMFVKGKKIKW